MIGSTLGPYRVIAKIGEGGMGEVYRAHDPRLGRDVAIKVLPAALTGDPDRLRRFEQEARAAAALNHPNILTVHEIGAVEGVPFVVSELLEGQTLRDALARGPLPPPVATRYALQILSGLAAAHDKGIVHRDLKPENLFITSDDRLKILDFGLAKLLEREPVTAGGTAASTRAADTLPGIVLGTIGYMSPEQVRGQDVDHRSDLFAFGAILYEMLTGQRAFQGESPADTISSILRSDPGVPSDAKATKIPAGLERIVRHCLEKDPGRRIQSARDLAWELETMADFHREQGTESTRSVWSKRGGLAAAAALGVVVGAAALWLVRNQLSTRGGDAPFVQQLERMTQAVGFSEWPAWSPDGRMFAFSSDRSGTFDIYVQRADGVQEPVKVTANAGDNVQPAYSPDGSSIAFVSTRSSRRKLTKIATFAGFDFRTYGGDVWVMPALGGQARRIAQDGNFPAWNPNGQAIAYVSGDENQRTILEASLAGGPPRPILSADASTWEIVRIAYSPSGRWITFESVDRKVMAVPTSGGAAVELVRGRAYAWSSDGRRVYYVGTDTTRATRIEVADVLEGASGLTVSAARIVGANTAAMRELAVAPDGRHLLVVEIEESLNLSRIPLTPDADDVAGPEEALSTGQLRDRYPSVSPDGKRVMVGSDRAGQQDLWILDLASRDWQRVEIPREAYDGVTGCWSKDSGHLFAFTVSGGLATLWSVAIDGSQTERLLPPAPGGGALSSGLFACDLSPDGRTLTYPALSGAFSQLGLVDLASRRQRILTTSPSHKYEASWSPDGRWIAFAANAGGSVNAFRIAASGGKEQQLTTGVERIRHVFYSRDSRWLYIQPDHRNIYRMPADGGPRQAVTHFPESSSLFVEEPRISPDGRYLVYNRGRGGSSIWLLTLDGR